MDVFFSQLIKPLKNWVITGHKGLQRVEGSLEHKKSNHPDYYRPTKLFVFGDSYADTGNIRKNLANSWKDPYGITFPGKPAGRFSDGRVLTDYIGTSSYSHIKSVLSTQIICLSLCFYDVHAFSVN